MLSGRENPERDAAASIPPFVSVIIPTYNRDDWLRELLDSLAMQTMPFERFEVLVVDDGSSDLTGNIAEQSFPFTLRYLFQANQGDAAARNFGARQSRAEILVFLDDDIILEPQFLAELVQVQEGHPNAVVVGTDILWLKESNPLLDGAATIMGPDEISVTAPIHFADVCSNNMSIYREAYSAVGWMDNLGFTGSSIWCDVDFSYRAYQKGFEFLRSSRAFCWHRDYVSRSMAGEIKRWQEAAYRAVVLFQKYPHLVECLPMFADKTPIVFRADPPKLIARKLLRRISSSQFAISGMVKLQKLFTGHPITAGFARVLRRWIIGASIAHGFREGLRDFGPIANSNGGTVLVASERQIQ